MWNFKFLDVRTCWNEIGLRDKDIRCILVLAGCRMGRMMPEYLVWLNSSRSKHIYFDIQSALHQNIKVFNVSMSKSIKIKWIYICRMPGYGGHSVCLPLAQQIRSGCLSLVSSHLSVPHALEYIPIWGNIKAWSYFLDELLNTCRPLGNFLLLFPTNGALTLSLINLKKNL